MLFASTAAIDSYYAVIGSLGDRFVITRITNNNSKLRMALGHKRERITQMRNELADAVAGLFAQPLPEPREISEQEIDRLDEIVSLAVKLRGTVERDRYTREIEAILGAEGTGRLGLALECLLAGLDTLGVDRAVMRVMKSVAFDSVPPIRRRAYEILERISPAQITTTNVAEKLGLPSNTARRALEDLVAYDLVGRESQGSGKPDEWWLK